MGGISGKKSVAGKRGSVGQEIFEQVERLTANGAMKKLDAFKQLASSSGRALGTVAANYYRVARQRGATLRTHRPTRRAGGSSKRPLAALLALVKELSAVIDAQQQRIAALEKENRRFDKLRRLLRA